jgi:hypothetical protein
VAQAREAFSTRFSTVLLVTGVVVCVFAVVALLLIRAKDEVVPNKAD